MKTSFKIILYFVIMGIGTALVLVFTQPPLDSPEEELGPAGIAYRGRLTEYEIVINGAEINIVEFTNKRGEHCMFALGPRGESELICENH